MVRRTFYFDYIELRNKLTAMMGIMIKNTFFNNLKFDF